MCYRLIKVVMREIGELLSSFIISTVNTLATELFTRDITSEYFGIWNPPFVIISQSIILTKV